MITSKESKKRVRKNLGYKVDDVWKKKVGRKKRKNKERKKNKNKCNFTPLTVVLLVIR